MNSSDHQNSLETNAAAKIASRVGDLPLALSLVASYASSIACSYHIFLQQYPEIDRDFLFQGLGDHLRTSQAYQESVDRTWTLGLQIPGTPVKSSNDLPSLGTGNLRRTRNLWTEHGL